MVAQTKHSAAWIARNRRIWAMARQANLDEEELRDLVESVTEGRSISGLSEMAQGVVIAKLDAYVGKARAKRRRQKKRLDGTKGDEVTHAQIGEIRRLASAIGWGLPALRAWLKRCFRVDREEWLTARTGTHAIQGLRSIQRQDRRKTAAT